MIAWDDRFLTGNQMIDQQHRNLFRLVNQMESGIEEGRTTVHLREILRHLKNYTATHFSYEEMCMARSKCAAACRNKDAHEKLLRVIEEFESRIQDEGSSEELARRLTDTMSQWLVGHIGTVDIELRRTDP